MMYSLKAPQEAVHADKVHDDSGAVGQFSRIGEWLKANF
jgi:hypothetical protein